MTDKKQKKQKKSNGGSRTSCWVFGSLLLFGGIASLIAYDTHALHNGVFEESSLGKVLKQTGNSCLIQLEIILMYYYWF